MQRLLDQGTVHPGLPEFELALDMARDITKKGHRKASQSESSQEFTMMMGDIPGFDKEKYEDILTQMNGLPDQLPTKLQTERDFDRMFKELKSII